MCVLILCNCKRNNKCFERNFSYSAMFVHVCDASAASQNDFGGKRDFPSDGCTEESMMVADWLCWVRGGDLTPAL